MIVHDAPQGSAEWHSARCGVFTASTFAQGLGILTRAHGVKKAGATTATSDELVAILALERITERPYRKLFESEWTSFGHAEEPMAKIAYTAVTGNVVRDAGLITTDDRKFGYSTDGLTQDETGEGCVEVKSMVSARRIAEFLMARDKRTWAVHEFGHQCKGGLWLTGFKWIDLIIWIPDLESVGKHFWCFRIHRDEDEIEQLETQLLAFIRRVDAMEEIFRTPSLAASLPTWEEVAPVTKVQFSPAPAKPVSEVIAPLAINAHAAPESLPAPTRRQPSAPLPANLFELVP